jgi:hypothetical protein
MSNKEQSLWTNHFECAECASVIESEKDLNCERERNCHDDRVDLRERDGDDDDDDEEGEDEDEFEM